MTTQHTMADPIHEALAEHRKVLAQRDELVRRAEDLMEWLEAQADLPGAIPHRVAKMRAALAKVA